MRSASLVPIVLLLGAAASPPAAAGDDVPPEAVVASLPFLDVEEPNKIYLDLAAADSKPLFLGLDTGAEHSVMTPLAARAAGVTVRAVKSSPYRRKTSLGRDLQFWVDVRTSDTGSKTGWEYGLLGGNFLREYVLELDFGKRGVRFLDPERYSLRDVEPAAGDGVLALRDGTRPIAEIAIDGKPLPVLIDTGSGTPVILSGAAARKLGIDVDALPEFAESQTTMGAMPLRLLESARLSIGGFEFEGVPVLVAPKGWYGMAGESNDSVIGYDLLSCFLSRIDYRAKRMLLRRERESVPFAGVDAAVLRRSGAWVWPIPSGLFVSTVVPETPAARRGLRAGDFIARDRGSDTPESILRAVADGAHVRVVRVENGESRYVELTALEASAN